MGDVLGTQDVSIWNKEETKAVTLTTVGSKEAIDTYLAGGSVTVSNNESPTKYQLKTDYDATGDSVGGTDVTLFSFTGSGVLDFIGVTNATSSNYEVAIVVDGTERFRITMSDLGTALNLIDSGTPVWAQTANKDFRYRPGFELGFTTSFAIKARATTGTQTLKHIVMFREKIT